METTLLTAIAILIGLNIASWFVLYQMIKQRGRLLLRMDDLERRLREVEQVATPRLESIKNTKAYVSGIPVGTLLNFQLPNIAGDTVALKDFRRQWVLLVAWNPNTESCRQIAPELARLQSELRRHTVQMLLISAQDKISNQHLAQKHGLECPILLLAQENDLDEFRNIDTPMAYLLDEKGYITYPRTLGTEQVLALAREAMSIRRIDGGRAASQRSLKASRIEREGLKADIPAPSFNLPTIYGETISLEQYRGRRLLLVFTSPHCAPCDYLAPHLVRLQQHTVNQLAVLIIGRGDPTENLIKAEAHGFTFPVVLQKHWEISKEYGIFSTPVAFLIDEGGIIAKNVAKGTEEILALTSEELSIYVEENYEQSIR